MTAIFTAEQMAQITTALNTKISAADTKATNSAIAAAAADTKATNAANAAATADTKATNAATAVATAQAAAETAQETANARQAQLYLHTISINGGGEYCGGKITLINRSATQLTSYALFRANLSGIVNLSLVNEEDSGYYMLSYDTIQLREYDIFFTNAVCLDAGSLTVGAHSIALDANSTYVDNVQTL